MSAPIQAIQNIEKQPRIPRRPSHTFRVDHKPWEIQCLGHIPVLPGETMKNLTIQSRAVTAPIKSPLQGWFLEYFVFYTTHRQMEIQTYLDMMLDPSTTLATSAANARDNYAASGHNWSSAIFNTIVKYWFREQGERATTYDIRAGRPAARINIENFHESFRLSSQVPVGGAVNTTDRSEEEKLQAIWEQLRMTGFAKMTYEDFLESYGVKSKIVDQKRPELLRHTKEWQYPSNTVNPANGTPTSAVSWSITERADKDRYFTEPGFVSVFSVARPKVYLANQTQAAIHSLDRAIRWLPAMLADSPEYSLAEFASTEGPFAKATGGIGSDYWLDMRDLFLHGDQWTDLLTTEQNSVALPAVGGEIKFPTLTMADALFVGTTDATRCIKQDGIIQCSILGTQMDYT